MNIMPSKMLNSFTSRKCTNPSIINTKIQLGTPMILTRMWINTIGLKCARQMDKFIVHHACIQSRLTFFMQINGFLFQLS